HELSYHVTEGYRIILETANFYISLGHTGVTKIQKEGAIEEIKQDGEVIDPFIHGLKDGPPWVDYESTLFVGEKLSSTERIDNYYLLTFTDFKLKLIPHDLDKDDISSLHRNDPWSYFPVLGAERHLTRKCPCGGDGELLLDFASDYVVRCQSCKRSTWAEMVAENAIKEWNEGRVRCDLSDITIE
ncbi:MAG: hypothetical protein J6V07_00560, partial [Clostridia bacterium]|nr:hypothetical protein [Clostridia bacterium]